MNNSDPVVTLNSQNDKVKRLKERVQRIIATQDLAAQRQLISAIAAELNISVLDCAAALLSLNEDQHGEINPPNATVDTPSQNQTTSAKQQTNGNTLTNQPGIRLVRYRLDLGTQHNATLDEIKCVLVEESGVDVKNITNVRILDSFTLIDLPDEMPQEIFHHLKLVEINGQKLDIRRVKARNKKRGNRRHRQAHPFNSPSTKEAAQ
jgi:DbpA RNA binding domain